LIGGARIRPFLTFVNLFAVETSGRVGGHIFVSIFALAPIASDRVEARGIFVTCILRWNKTFIFVFAVGSDLKEARQALAKAIAASIVIVQDSHTVCSDGTCLWSKSGTRRGWRGRNRRWQGWIDCRIELSDALYGSPFNGNRVGGVGREDSIKAVTATTLEAGGRK